MNINVEELTTKRDEMTANLKAYVEQANRQIAAMEGAIGMLDQLIVELTIASDDAAAVDDSVDG